MSQFIKKASITAVAAIVAVTMVAPAPAQAAALTQAQINAIVSLLQSFGADSATVSNVTAALSGQPTSGTGTGTGVSGVPAGYTWTRSLTVGDTGTDVRYLQILLNSNSATQVATTGAGSPGNETTTFGPLTAAAVTKFQNTYASEVLAPLGLSAGTGYFGSSSRAKAATLAVGGTGSGTGTGTGTGTTTPVPTTGQFTVSLAPNTPASSTVVAGQGTADIAKFTLSNGTGSSVKITNLKMKRLGVSNDSTLSNVYIFDGARRATDAASVSTSVITFNNAGGVVTIPANSAKTITVKADIATSTSGQTVGVGILEAADITTDGPAVSGSFPLNGNLHTAATATLAGAYFNATTTPSGTGTPDPQDDFTVWQNTVQIVTRKVTLSRIAFRQIGSVDTDDLQNFRLFIDGAQVGSAVNTIDSTSIGDYLTFDLSASPKTLDTGSRTVKVLADIIGGSNKTFSLSLRNAADAEFTDSEFGVNVKPTVTNATTSFSARTTGTQTISTGTVTITKKTDSPSGNIVKDASAQVLGRWEVKAAGEAVKIEFLRFTFTASNASVGSFRNGQVYANGTQIGSTATLNEDSQSTAYTEYTFGSSLIVEPGSPVTLELRSDIFDNDGTDDNTAADTLTAKIVSGNLDNAFGQTSATTIDVPSAANGDKSANQLTIQTGALTLSQYSAFAAPTYVVEKTAAKLGHFTLNAGTTEAVNINTITIDYTTATATNASNMYVKYGSNTTNIKSTVAAADNDFTINYELAAGATIDIEVFADVASGSSAETAGIKANVTGVTKNSGTTTYGATSSGAGTAAGRTDGQLVTYSAGGTIVAELGNTPATGLVAGGGVQEVGTLTFSATDDDFTVTEMKLKLGIASNAATANVVLKNYDTGATIATQPFAVTVTNTNDTAYFTGLSIAVPKNGEKKVKVALDLTDPTGTASAASGTALALTLTQVKHIDTQGTQTEDTTPGPGNSNPATKTQYVYAAYPQLTEESLPASTFIAGNEVVLYKWSVSSNGGNINVKQYRFSFTFGDNGTDQALQVDTFKLKRNGVDITDQVTIMDSEGGSVESTTTAISDTIATPIAWVVWDDNGSDSIGSTAVTYELRGTPRNFSNEGTNPDDTLTVQLTNTDTTIDVRNYLAKTSAGIHQLAATANQSTGTAASLIWSDVSATSHNSRHDASGTADWHNGFLLKDSLGSKTVTAN